MKRGIDHLVLCVSDLDRAIAFYRRAGFTTTPRAQHPWGTDNTLVQLQGCFLELLTIARPELIEETAHRRFGFGAFNRDFLARGEGMSMLVFESNDARSDRDALSARGLPPWDVFDFERQARLPDGSSVRVAFSLAFATDERMPHAAFFFCQQHAPEYFWKPEYQRHDNGAHLVDEVVMVAARPAQWSDFFAAVQEPESIECTDDCLGVSTPRGRISVLTPSAAQRRFRGVEVAAGDGSPRFVGYSLRVADMDRAAEVLRGNDVKFVQVEDRIRIAAADAFGVVVELAAGT